MYAAVLTSYRNFVWKEVNTPQPEGNEVLIKVTYASICGSDQHVFSGEFHPRTPVPFIPGHEFAGIVANTGSDVKKFKVGDRVTVDPIIWCGTCPACLQKHYPACTSLKLVGIDLDGGFAEYVKVPETMVYTVSSGISDQHSALIEVLSIGFHACNRAGVQQNNTIVIWGAGKVGQCILQAAKTKTTDTIILVDILDSRLERARSAYPDIHTINASTSDPVTQIKNITCNKGVDIAFEAVGHAHEIHGQVNPVRGCVQSIKGGGTVCVLGLSDQPSPLIMKELIWKEARIIASRVSHGEFSETIEKMNQQQLKPDALVTDVIKPNKIQKAFEMLENEPDKHLKILLDFS